MHPSFTSQVQRCTSLTPSAGQFPNTDNAQGEFQQVNALKLLPMNDERLEEMKTSTCDDEVLQQLKEGIQIGWPKEKLAIQAVLAPNFSFRDKMSVINSLVFKMKEHVHSSHIGVHGCLQRAMECMYWTGMTAELKEYISQSETCTNIR